VTSRKIRDKARIIAASMLEANADDLEWEQGRWFVKGDPEQGATIQDIAMAAHGTIDLPEGVEPHLDATTTYDPRT
jgi:carbon-monoxide dehydrogenase large subunit